MMAVPFKGSGLEHTDFKKLLALMEEIKAEEGLPLTDASTRVWEELSRLRYEVAGACKISSEDEIADIIESRSEEDIANINATREDPHSLQPASFTHARAPPNQSCTNPRFRNFGHCCCHRRSVQ